MDNDCVLGTLNHIREFQISDLNKSDDAGANFLVCVGCLNATEVLGGIRTGFLGMEEPGYVRQRLENGIGFLGPLYWHHKDDILALRNSMVHAYLGKSKNYPNVDIMNKNDLILKLLPLDLGIQVVNGRFTVNVSSFIKDLETAWQRLMEELKANPSKVAYVGAMLEELPYLR